MLVKNSSAIRDLIPYVCNFCDIFAMSWGFTVAKNSKLMASTMKLSLAYKPYEHVYLSYSFSVIYN